MTQLVTCPECNRHLRQTEATCPFCGAGVREAFADVAARRMPGPGLSRAAILAFAAASVGGGACGGETASPAPGTGGAKGTGGFTGTGSAMGSGGVAVGAGGATGGFMGVPPYGAPPYGIPPFSGGAPGAGGSPAAGGAADAGVPPGFDCIDLFSGGKPTRCCPNPHDCTGKPEGWPGYACAPAHESYCSCACSSGQWLCYC